MEDSFLYDDRFFSRHIDTAIVIKEVSFEECWSHKETGIGGHSILKIKGYGFNTECLQDLKVELVDNDDKYIGECQIIEEETSWHVIKCFTPRVEIEGEYRVNLIVNRVR